MDLVEIKAAIRAILMALGRRATEKEFRSEFFNQEGESFNCVLRQFGMTFFEFLRTIPDVCRVFKLSNDEVFVEKVSHEESRHMDNLTVVKNRKRSKPRFKQVPRYNVFRPPPFQRHQQPFCAPAPSRAFAGSNSRAAPAFSRPAAPIVTPKPQPFVPAKPKSFTPIQTKPLSKVPPRKLSLGLPPHMLMKPITFSSNDEKKEESLVSEASSEEKKAGDDLNKSSTSSLWSDEKGPSNKPKKLNRFRLRLTNPLNFMQQKEDEKSSFEETAMISLKESSESEKTVEEPKKIVPSNAGFIRRAFQKFQTNLQRPEKRKEPSVLENYVTGAMAYPQPHMMSIKCLTSFEATIVSVQSPSHFGFTFSRNQLQALHTEMAVHYSIAEGIEVERPVVGMPVAVAIDGMWHRAEVLYVNPCDVLILLVDLGVRKYVNIRELRYLEKGFAAVSRKACRGRLFGVHPAEGEDEQWSDEATALFSQKTKNVKLKATVKAFKDGYYELSLVNESNNYMKVADQLVNVGLAEKVAGADNSLSAVLV